jgi:Ca-activated chloride channel family protein
MITRTIRHTIIAIGLLAASAQAKGAEQVQVDVAVAKPYLLAGQKQTTYLRVGLTGIPIKNVEQRTPVNVAIVLDKSGSMTGEKLRKAKEAAIASIDRLGPNDIVSVIAYDQTVDVLVPATKVSDRKMLHTAIERLSAGGSTALFAGVSKGAAEVRKFRDRQRVNRIILLSDGQANVGPSSPADLGNLGGSLIKEGISVTTLGLGLDYNEDLMTQLARKSDGNHYFIENTVDLARQFGYEFDDVLSVVAQEVTVRITCAPGVRPVRVLGREADITGQTATTYVNQVYGNQEKYVLLEVEVPAESAAFNRNLADVSVTYVNMATKTAEKVSRGASVAFTSTAASVEANINPAVMASAIEQIAVERNKQAVALRDQGKIEEARRILLDNATFLGENAVKYNSKELEAYKGQNRKDADNLDPAAWESQRKAIMRDQTIRQNQQGQGQSR